MLEHCIAYIANGLKSQSKQQTFQLKIASSLLICACDGWPSMVLQKFCTSSAQRELFMQQQAPALWLLEYELPLLLKRRALMSSNMLFRKTLAALGDWLQKID